MSLGLPKSPHKVSSTRFALDAIGSLFGVLYSNTSKIKEMGGKLALDGQNLMETHNN